MNKEQQIEAELRDLVRREPNEEKFWDFIKSQQDEGLSGVTAYLIVTAILDEYSALRASNAQEASRIEYRSKMALESLLERIWYDPRNNLDENWPYHGRWPFEDGVYPWQNK